MLGFEIENWNIEHRNWGHDYDNVAEFRSSPCKVIDELKNEIIKCFTPKLLSISRTEREPDNFVGFHIHFSRRMNEKVDFIKYAKLYNVLHAIHPMFFNSFDENTYSRRIHRGDWCYLDKIGVKDTYDNYGGRSYSILTPNHQNDNLITLEFRLPDLPYHIDMFSLLWNIYSNIVEQEDNRKVNDYILYEEKLLNTSKDKIKVIPTPIMPQTFGKDTWQVDELIPEYLSSIIGNKIIVIRDGGYVHRDTERVVRNILDIQQKNANDYADGKRLKVIGQENYKRIAKEVIV